MTRVLLALAFLVVGMAIGVALEHRSLVNGLVCMDIEANVGIRKPFFHCLAGGEVVQIHYRASEDTDTTVTVSLKRVQLTK